MRITCTDEALTKMVAGRETVFAAYLQLDAQIEPHVNDAIRDLLETLFPTMPMWVWD